MPQLAQDFVGGRVGDQAAAPGDHQTVGVLLYLAHQVAGDQHGSSLVGELSQESPDPSDTVEVQAEHHPHGCGLARPVEPEKPGDLARLYDEVEVVDGQDVVVPLGQAAYLIIGALRR